MDIVVRRSSVPAGTRTAVVAARQHESHKFCLSLEPALLFCVSPFVGISLISRWREEKFTREWTNVPDAVGFAFAMEA